MYSPPWLHRSLVANPAAPVQPATVDNVPVETHVVATVAEKEIVKFKVHIILNRHEPMVILPARKVKKNLLPPPHVAGEMCTSDFGPFTMNTEWTMDQFLKSMADAAKTEVQNLKTTLLKWKAM